MFLPVDLSVGYNYISTTDVIHLKQRTSGNRRLAELQV